MTGLRCVWTVPLPGGNMGEAVVVTLGLSLGGLVFLPEVAAARLLSFKCVAGHQLGQVEEVGNPSRLFQGLVERVGAAEDPDVPVELFSEPPSWCSRFSG